MAFRNPLTSIGWKLLFRASSPKSRRRRRDLALSTSVAADILESRVLLSAEAVSTVTAAITGRTLTLTSDNNSPTVNVFRLDSNNIEIDGVNGTLISYKNSSASSQVIKLANVFGITVNLGTGFDTYTVESVSGAPALNIGGGGVRFQGKGGQGGSLTVTNASDAAMTISGNVVVQGNGPGGSLKLTGTQNSQFTLTTQFAQSNSDTPQFNLATVTKNPNSLTVNG
jgi:hypothetical protein